MSRPLPLRADLEWLKKLSKERLAALRAQDPAARLSQAQLAVAREFGFPSWRKLKSHVEEVRGKLDAIVSPELRRRAAADRIAPDDPDLASFTAAIHAGQVQAVAEQLARRPALAAALGPEGQPPLHLAAQYNDPQIAAVLVAYGADLHATFGQSGHTALSWAITCNAPECALALVKLGAEPDLFCAAGMGAVEIVQTFFDAAGELVAGASRSGSSRFAADGSRLLCPPVDAREQISDALAIACRNGHVGVVEFLLGKNPDLSFRAFLGATPLHWAHFGGSQAAVKLLEDSGASALVRDVTLGCLPRSFGICVAANWGFSFLVRARLDQDPSLVNVMDGRTSPLHEAVRNNREEVVRLLVERGADPALTDGDGKTPLEIAGELGHGTIVDILRVFIGP